VKNEHERAFYTTDANTYTPTHAIVQHKVFVQCVPLNRNVQNRIRMKYRKHGEESTQSGICLLALQLVLLDGERHLEQVLLLLLVRVLKTSSDRGAGVTSSIHDVPPVVVLGLVEKSLNPRLGETPCTSVERLLLTPNDVLGVGVRVEVLLQLLPWEGVELFNTGDRDILQATRLALLDKRSIDLTSAKNDAVDLVMRSNFAASMSWVLDDPLEVRLARELFQIRTGQWVTQKRLGEEQNERLAELAVHLATKQVEVVRRLGAVGDLDVAILVLSVKLIGRREDAGVLVDELQVALHACRRVFWSLTVVSMRQAHHEAGALEPLDLTGGDELINDDLSSVGEITELGFPHDKGVGR
jgi:hypothetical protein